MEKILFKLFIYITAFILETINLYRFNVRTISKTLAILKLRLDKVDGPVIAQVKIPESSEWSVVNHLY